METIPSLLQPASLSPSHPSLFELLASQHLASLLPPTTRYLLALLTHRYPRYLLRVLNSFDEVYALLQLIIERYYLKTYGGTFVENFYNLKRERVLSVKSGELRRTELQAAGATGVRERVRLGAKGNEKILYSNLLLIVGSEYLKRKLDEHYDIYIAPSASLLSSGGPRWRSEEDLPPNPTLRQRLFSWYKSFLRHFYPSINLAYYLSILTFSLGYLFDSTQYSSPLLWLTSTRIRRLGQADFKAFEELTKIPTTTPGAKPGQGLSGLLNPRTLSTTLLSSLRLLLPSGIMLLKFLEWYYQSDFSRQLLRKAAEGLDLPPPVTSGMDLLQRPQKPSSTDTKVAKANQGVRRNPPISSTSYLPIFTVPPPPSTDLCPICLHPIESPASCQTGVVYDYKCIFQWVEGEHVRQEEFMKGLEGENEWFGEGGDEEGKNRGDGDRESREGKWESGKGRCAVTGRRVLGGTGGIRRVMV